MPMEGTTFNISAHLVTSECLLAPFTSLCSTKATSGKAKFFVHWLNTSYF